MRVTSLSGLTCGLVVLAVATPLAAQAKPAPDAKASPWEALAALPFRDIGPAKTSGRVGDLAVDPVHPSTWYVAAASGGVWKTTNAGTTWTSIFNHEGSYSIGCITLDPKDPLTVWVGTGENNSQRSVGFGDGIYKSVDGGKTWEHMGLKTSEHLAKVVIDPRDSKVVYVASQGPLWSPGGERGLYKSTDGGKTWKAVLTVNEHTGVTDVVLDPRNPEVLYAATYQRRRHVWTLINGGPESGIHKSTDGGATWRKLSTGLPKEEMGRIGLALSPQDPDTVYATIEAAEKGGGFFASTDGGASWEKRSTNVSGAAMYYQELFPDPHQKDRIYAMDTWMQVTEDGGKTWRRAGEKHKHVDNHALWIDPADPAHLLAGSDGGLYESFDRAATWTYKANLPIAQFYRVTTDSAAPFYNVYGGTQDNYSLGGPSRTANLHGASNDDWFVTWGGDGFVSQVDPTDPNTVYAEAQYGALARFDRRTGEGVDIQPQPAPGEQPFRWNWDSPLLISPHNPKRLYFAANKVFRSDDRGDGWKAVSPDLTRRLDRDALKVMGRLWSVDAVARHHSTSAYGNLVALVESPVKEGLLFAGSDDGLVQVTEDGGGTWRKVETFPGVPERTYVSALAPSPHGADTVYAAFNNHKLGDFKPYLLRSRDRGRTWESIAGNLPARGPVHVVKEDPARKDLLYAGTEFGLFFSPDGGKSWIRFKELPTIPVRDLAIQTREGDLVAATFGRGIQILDDLTPLREAQAESFGKAHLFGSRPAWAYVPATPLGGPGKSFQGEAYFTAPNPPFGAVFTYHLPEALKSRKQQRRDGEKATVKAGGDVATPTWEALKAEDREAAPEVVLTIAGADGTPLRRLTAPAKAGLHRLAWDLRLPVPDPINLKPPVERDPWDDGPKGALAAPGAYTASLGALVDGELKPLGQPVRFEVKPLWADTVPAAEREAIAAFQRQATDLQRQALALDWALTETLARLDHVKKALVLTPQVPTVFLGRARALELRLKDLQERLHGDGTRAARQAPTAPGVLDRIGRAVGSLWGSTRPATATQRQDLAWAAEELARLKPAFREALDGELKALEAALDAAGAPHTPGR